MDDPDEPGADQSRSTSRDRMGNGHEVEFEAEAGDGYQGDAHSTGPYRRYSIARSNSSFYEDVEMAQDQVSSDKRRYPVFQAK